MPGAVRVRPAEMPDRPWIAELLRAAWASPRIVTRGRLHDGMQLPALIAEIAGRRAGLLLYRLADGECEIVALNSAIERQGAASGLLEAIQRLSRQAGCRRVWLITSNDNLSALGFYQRRGYALVAVHRGGIDQARRLKPEIPPIGLGGIPLRDEIELEYALR